MPLPFNKHLDVKLIKLVKDNPLLYNTKLPKYVDFDSREVIWQKIGDNLNRPALKFAGIQCQVQYGDFQEEKHKPGFIENLKEYLPEEFASSRTVEKKIIKLYKQHQGLSQLDAKLLYTKTARDLPTYGVTFFLVKEKQKGKKKLIPRLLGINAESILRLDEVTKEILQVWPLTHMKSYHTGKSDTFTLNFGDYSDQEYSCKTNEVLRIKDILEGYIDITRKRMGKPYGGHQLDSGAICQENVEVSSANMITHVSNKPSQIVEHSIVGPSTIIESTDGSTVSQGTQIMTVQQVLVTNKGTTQQRAVTGEVRMRSDMSLPFTRKLNGLNANSVKIVTILTDSTVDNIKEAQKIVKSMEQDMPSIIQGVQEASEKQTTPEAQQKLLNELDQLRDLVNSLSTASRKEDFNPDDVQESARRIADLTTQIYFAVDARTKRRSDLVRRSRQSFIADERTDATLRRASFLAAAAIARDAVDNASRALDKVDLDKSLSSQEIEQLQDGALDQIGKLNAAVALYLTAHSDPKNIDYIQALTSMNTINELMPELTKDAKMLSSAHKNEARQAILDDMKMLCDATRKICLRTDCEGLEKIQEPGSEFAEASGRLVYLFGSRNRKVNADKENEILDLAKDVGEATTVLLMKVNSLATPEQSAAQALDAGGARAADLTRGLLLCAQLTAPSIHEPHCQSALTSSVENLSSSVQHLALTWAPLVEDGGQQLGDELQAASIDLAKALDRLKNSYADLREDEVADDSPEGVARAQRLKFMTTVTRARDAMEAAAEELNKPVVDARLTSEQTKQLENDISHTMAQINAAVASLIHAKSDKNNPDYATSELAVATISELMPEVIRDTKALSSSCADPDTREAMMRDVTSWCAGVRDVSACAAIDDVTELDAAAKNFAVASRKLKFVFSPRANNAREQLLMELSKSVHNEAIQLVDSSHTMANTLGGANGEKLRARGNDVGSSARALLTAAELTAPSIDSARCKCVLLETADSLSTSARALLSVTSRIRDDETGCHILADRLHVQRDDILRRGTHLDASLNKFRDTCEGKNKLTPPPLPVKTSTLRSKVGGTYAVPKDLPESDRRISQQFLDHLRTEESCNHNIPPPSTFADKKGTSNKTDETKKEEAAKPAMLAKPEEEILLKNKVKELAEQSKKQMAEEDAKRKILIAKKEEDTLKLKKSVQYAVGNIHKAEIEMKKRYGAKNVQVFNDDQIEELEQKLERKLAAANDAAVGLVASHGLDEIECSTACQHIDALSILMPQIITDATLLSSGRDDKSKKALLDETSALCEATRKLCTTTNDGDLKVNDAAVAFGDKSARLIYLLSSDVHPAQGKEVISRAGTIHEKTYCLLKLCEANAPGAGGTARRCADSADTILCTAKVLAPSIQHKKSQQVLTTACHDLSANLKTLRTCTKENLALDPQSSKQLIEETDKLEKLIKEFRSDLEGGRLVKRKEKIVIEDTPLRQLACTILNDAKKRSEMAPLPNEKESFNEYARMLAAAIKDLDVTNSRVKQTPHNLNKLQELENAVQQLQYIVLQSRPTLGDKQKNNIVDLTEFVKDVSTEADRFMGVVNKTNVRNGENKIAEIKAECHNISMNGLKLQNPSDQQNTDDSALDDILEVDNFRQDCDKRIKYMDATINRIEDKNAKDLLHVKMMPLEESNNLLRFATKSALATAKSIVLEETLKDLEDLETKIDEMLVPTEGSVVRKVQSAELWPARARLCARAGREGSARALLAYISALRQACPPQDTDQRHKLKQHVDRLVDLLKQLTSRASVRAATWCPSHGPDVNGLVTEIIQELSNSEVGCEPEKPITKIIDDIVINKLLLPSRDVKITGSKKQLSSQLSQCSSNLSSMSVHLARSVACEDELRRNAGAAVEEATLLADTARALSGEGRTVSPVKRLQSECEELTRLLQLQSLSQTAQPTSSLSYSDSVDVLQSQAEVMNKLESDAAMSRDEFVRCVSYVTSAVCNSTELAAQCAYLISISEQNKEVAKVGLVDISRLQKLAASAHDICYRILRTGDVDQAKEDETQLLVKMQELQQAIKDSNSKINDTKSKRDLTECAFKIDVSTKALHSACSDSNVTMEKINAATVTLLDSMGILNSVLESPELIPTVGEVSAEIKSSREDIEAHSKKLLTETQALISEVKKADDQDPMTWVTFNSHRTGVLRAFENLLVSLKTNGRRAGLVQATTVDEEELEEPEKSYIQIQLEVAKRWLLKRPLKTAVQTAGVEAARNIIDLSQQLCEDMSGQEREDMRLLISETEDLLKYCSKTYDEDRASALLDRLVELRKLTERGAVSRLMEDFLEAEEPLCDFEIFIDAEKDESRREKLLERKIAELLSTLRRVRSTARLAAECGARTRAASLTSCCDQTELLAPLLVKAAQERVRCPNEPAVVENFRRVLAQYTESLTRVRDLCDQTVDPMEFVQTAGEIMQRMRDVATRHADLETCARTNTNITRLARRVITVGLSSAHARDPAVQSALQQAELRLAAADCTRTGVRASRLPDCTAEILRTTGEVESALGGENIFQQQPEPDKPIYNAAHSLHAAAREWSARDNELVAVAKRMAVLMARLSDYMLTDKKRELIQSSKSIVMESHEVSRFAKKLAHECNDVRIRSNLLQVCERIPTISGQLKMLTTVKGSSLGQQDSQEDKESMDTLVWNAQNLMSSVQEVLKAAASASVKIASQRGGPKMRWVRRNYY